MNCWRCGSQMEARRMIEEAAMGQDLPVAFWKKVSNLF
jgi:hypothetical protein